MTSELPIAKEFFKSFLIFSYLLQGLASAEEFIHVYVS